MSSQDLTPEKQWRDTLTDLRGHLAGVREALDDGNLDDIVPFAVPDGLPGMPVACAAEARSLVDEQHRVELAVRDAMDDHRPTMQRPPQSATGFRRSRFEARA